MNRALDTDVLIVGAGPTGLMLANCLARLGVRFVIIDGKSGPTRESRALGLQARTLELYDQLGIVHRVLSQAQPAGSIVPGFERRRFRTIDFRRLATGVTPYPQVTVLEQSRNERLLVDHLGELGGRVHWKRPLLTLKAGPQGVTCTTGGAEPLTISARFCVGADGSSSTVRQLAGIDFEGETNPHTFYVTDAAGVTGLPLESVNLRFAESDFMLSFPMGPADHHRLLGVVRNPDDAALLESEVRETLQRVFGVGYGDSRWFSTYRVHHRVAARFRAGPVFLAGDAAHVHSPVGAQGMNTGLQDAHNLACKLADVIVGGAPETSLDRFEAERRPVALRLVSTTDTMFGLITSDRRRARFLRRHVFSTIAPVGAFLVSRLVTSPRIFEYLSQTRIHYWMSDAARRAAHGRRGRVVGRRLPYNGDNFRSLRLMAWQVHAYGDAAPPELRHLRLPVTVFPVVRNRKLRSGMCYLVRPDGFVAAVAPPASAAAVFAAALPNRAARAPG